MDLYRLWDYASRLCQLAIAVGIAGALAQWRPGAYLMVGGLAVLVGSRITIALVEYRRVMSRPWPVVPPLADDDW